MRQRRWLDLLKDYDCEIRYHPGKANVVADALSQKEREKVIRIHSLRMIVTFDLFDRIKAAQLEVLREQNWKDNNVKELLLEEVYKSKYSIHPGATKMYLDLKRNYWWPGPVAILGRKQRQLCNKEIPLVKVEWKHRKDTSIRWESEEKMRIRSKWYGKRSVTEGWVMIWGFLQNPTGYAEVLYLGSNTAYLINEYGVFGFQTRYGHLIRCIEV
ncbi:putative reverse transcriptase domain-containing protein [Tanacetum coccineum]